MYSGLSSAVIGSAPGGEDTPTFPNGCAPTRSQVFVAATFFVTYEHLKQRVGRQLPGKELEPVVHMISASGGEVVCLCYRYAHWLSVLSPQLTRVQQAACFVRVPTEVVKQRMQTGQYTSVSSAVSAIAKLDGLRGFYRGYSMTIFREVYPSTSTQRHEVGPVLIATFALALFRFRSAVFSFLCMSASNRFGALITAAKQIQGRRLFAGRLQEGSPRQ